MKQEKTLIEKKALEISTARASASDKLCEFTFLYEGVKEYTDPATGKVTRELRTRGEIEKAIANAAMVGKPLMDADLPFPCALTSKVLEAHQRGVIASDGWWCEESSGAKVSLLVQDDDVASALQHGGVRLVASLTSDDIHEPGVWNGEPYDVIQTNLKIDHVSLVPEDFQPLSGASCA